jgi:hypothetical protein
MKKLLFIVLMICLTFPVYAEGEQLVIEETALITEAEAEEEVEEVKQSSFAKEVCTDGSLEEAINVWAAENPGATIETMSVRSRDGKECGFFIYELE